MDGNKKLTGIVFAGIIALALTACKVQSPGYVGLYIDNLTLVNDTIYPGESPLNMLDTALIQVVNPTSFIDSELPVYLLPAEEIVKISSESVYQLEVEKLLKAITDSVQLLDYQMNELQKQLAVMPDTSFTGEKQQHFQPRDSLQTELDFRQLIQVKNEQIFELQKQLNELQNLGIINSDTSYMVIETVKSPIAESQQSDYLSQQMLRDTNDKIQKLQKQLNSLQNTAVRTPRQTNIRRGTSQVQTLSNQPSDQLTLQLFQAQNDTIQFLKSQLRNLQPEPQTDSVYKEKEAKVQAAKELVAEQKETDLQVLQDAIQFLKTRLQSLEVQTPSDKDTPEDERAPYNAKTDTTLIVAYYNRGEIKPRETESVLKHLKELVSNKNVTKITLSGFTDSSGSEIINKEITNKRLNYLSEKMIPLIPKEKMFFQNFGDVYASDTMVSDERRIEIRIHTK